MKFKGKLAITSAVATAMLAAGCDAPAQPNDGWQTDQDTAVCVDKQGRRVDDDRCDSGGSNGAGMGMFMLFYMSRGGYVPAHGQAVNRKYGSYKPAKGKSYFKSKSAFGKSSISRGGFGSSSRSSVGG